MDIEKEYKVKQIPRRTSAFSISDKRAYLRGRYTNEEGYVICQMCELRMFFKLKGWDYFVTPQCVESAGSEHLCNHLALCPNCAAELVHCQSTDEEILVALLKLDPLSEIQFRRIYLRLPSHKGLYFEVGHLIDLQAALEVEELVC